MDLSTLSPAKGSVRTNKRLGRGYGSGNGQTAGRGHKGAKSRSGYSRKIGFEGGQMPLYRRLPKSGFKNVNRIEYTAINLDVLERLATEKGLTTIDRQVLKENYLSLFFVLNQSHNIEKRGAVALKNLCKKMKTFFKTYCN